MSTRACPVCHEIIPSDVDYCPFCGESTMERLHTDDDLVAARNAEARDDSVAVDDAPRSDSADPSQPPVQRAYMCMMCGKRPPADGEYCAECREKLDLGPEQWDLMKQETMQRNITTAIVVVLVLLLVATIVATSIWRHRAAVAYAPAPPGLKYAPAPQPPPGPPQISPAPGPPGQPGGSGPNGGGSQSGQPGQPGQSDDGGGGGGDGQ